MSRNCSVKSFVFVVFAFSLFATSGARADMDHQHMHHGDMGSPLTEAGNDAFGTVQEVVAKLQANPNTDWSKVDLEALRQHLVDMDNFTKQVTVIGKKDIANGVELTVQPDNERARGSLERALAAHPAMVQQETGWNMKADIKGKVFRITVTSSNPKDTAQIRGLGYIGLMALGHHHQAHHWAMANGINPHSH